VPRNKFDDISSHLDTIHESDIDGGTYSKDSAVYNRCTYLEYRNVSRIIKIIFPNLDI